MKNFKRIIIALIVACVVIASCPVSGSIVDAATIKVKSGANVTKVEKSGKKYVAYRGKQAVKPRKGWYKKGNTQYYFDGKKNYATYVWYKKSDKWYLKKWKSGSYKKYTGYAELSNGKTYKFSKGVKGKKASGVVKVSGKYYYYKGGKQTVYSKSCDKWKTGKTQYYFGKGNKSATYVYYSGKKILKKWNKTSKQYVNYNKAFTLSNGTKYVFNNGNRGTIKSSVTAGSKNTTAVYRNAKGNPKNVTGWKQVKGVQYYFNNAATASFKIEKDMCWVFITDAKNQAAGNQETNDHWEKYSGVVDKVYYVKGKVKPAEKDTVTTDQSGLLVKYDGKEWKLLTGTYKKLYYVNGDYASGIVDGKYYKKGKLATGICNDKYYRDGVLGTGSYNDKRYSKGSLLTGDYKNKFYKNGELYTGMRKSNGKYYVNGELATGSYENKYYKDGELYTGVYKSKYYKDGTLGTGTCNGKFYKNGELYTGIRKSNGKYYVDGVPANGTYDGVKYVDGVAQSDSEDPSETEEKLTEGEFRTNSGKLQHCEAVLYTGDIGTFPNLWNFRDGKLEMGIESTFNVDNYVNFIKRDNKYYHLEWVDYTGEYEGKLYESGKAVDYKVRTKSGDLFTGWAIYEDVIPNAATEFYHLTTGKSHNLVYVENGAVKQYYVYEKMEDHSWCNGCGADMEVSPYWSSAGVNPALDDHKEHDHPQFDHQSFNGGPVYKYTNNGKTYWVTNPHNNFYRWDTTKSQYVEHFRTNSDQTGRECVDSDASSEFYGSFIGLSIVYSASDWKIGQCSIVLVNKDIVLK